LQSQRAGGILAAGGTVVSLQTAAARIIDNSTANSLGNPIFVEKGKIIGVLSVNPVQLELTFISNATINGNIVAKTRDNVFYREN
jgi:transcriptional regulator of acetoin/glycerol metabolism